MTNLQQDLLSESPVSKPPQTWGSTGKVVAYAVELALLGLLAWGLIKVRAGPLQSGLVPDFTLSGFDGRTVKLTSCAGRWW